MLNNNDTMAKILLAVTQSDEWFRICDGDAEIQEANNQLQAFIDKLALPDEQIDPLWDAICYVCNACTVPAVLYGIRVANAIRDISTQQLEVAMQVLRQSRAQTEKGSPQ